MKNLMNGLLIAFLLSSCGEDTMVDPGINPGTDPMDDKKMGQIGFQITDAPIDNAEVKSCVVTIQEIHVDGQKVEGFQKTSVNLLAYQKGETFDLGTFDVEAKQYSSLELVLDLENDASGTKPGCYVEEQDGQLHALSLASGKITLDKDLGVDEGSKSTFVLDVDLRKSIHAEADNEGNLSYDFVSGTELNAAVRVLQGGKTGIVKGTCQNNTGSSSKIVAYAYHQGQFDSSSELNGKGQSKILFAQAVNSALCDEEGRFELHFLDEGNYDLYFASYEENSNGHLTLKGMFSVGGLLTTTLSPVSVSTSANATATVEVSLMGLLGL